MPKIARLYPFVFCFWLIFATQVSWAKVVRYQLNIEQKPMNISGKGPVDFALTVNGQIPAPTLEFTEGDDAEILVVNHLKNDDTSVHWHGILLPPEEDGVPYLTTPPILPGQSRLFRFKIRQHGTYWYHSHTMLQEQKGVYGALVIHPKKKPFAYDRDLVLVLSDWSDENADQILRNLRKDGDYYLYKKNSMRSYWGAIKAHGLKTYLQNEWSRMPGMDLSDVGYDTFLINGKKDSQLATARLGEKIRLRVINAGASSYFYIRMGAPMTVVSADGVDVQPIPTEEILMGMGETNDLLWTVPDQRNYEIRATAQDGTGSASAWIGGKGERVAATPIAPIDLYAPMEHSMAGDQHEGHTIAGHGDGDHGSSHSASDRKATTELVNKSGGHQGHAATAPLETSNSHSDHSENSAHAQHPSSTHEGHHMTNHSPPTPAVLPRVTVDSLTALTPTKFLPIKKKMEFKLVLGGDMERYVWHINGKAIHEDKNIFINKDDIIRFIFVNETMMHHPMHLHGHFFRVLTDKAEWSPLKHTVDVPPHGSRTIEFIADEPGQWMLHCHNLYHMKTGMARVVNYLSYQPSPEMAAHQKHDPHDHEHIYSRADLAAYTNQASLAAKLSRTWDELALRVESKNTVEKNFRTDGTWEWEGDLLYRRYLSNYLNFMVGGASYDKNEYGLVGFGYILPFLLETQVFLNHEGHVRVDLHRRFQWTKNWSSEVEWMWRPEWDGDHESEWHATLTYAKSWSWGVGLNATPESLGIGGYYRF